MFNFLCSFYVVFCCILLRFDILCCVWFGLVILCVIISCYLMSCSVMICCFLLLCFLEMVINVKITHFKYECYTKDYIIISIIVFYLGVPHTYTTCIYFHTYTQ